MNFLDEHWLGICAAAGLIVLLVLVIRYHVHAFLALIAVSLGLGLAAGLPPVQVVDAISKGIAEILREVLLLLALGALLGRLLETSGAAELIARRLIDACGTRNTSFAILVAAFIVGIPVLFNVGFLVLIPIIWRLQKETTRSLLYFLLPLSFSLGITHSLVPPHPGIVAAVGQIMHNPQDPTAEGAKRVMVETIVLGIALAFPLALIGWFLPGRFWASRHFVTVPENMSIPADKQEAPVARSLTLALVIILAPLVLSILGFSADMLQKRGVVPERMGYVLFEHETLPRFLEWLNHSPLDWLRFMSRPTVALLVPTALALWCYGLGRGWSHAKLAKVTNDALIDVGGMVFLFGAAGGFKQVIEETNVGAYITAQMQSLPLSKVAIAFLIAAMMRIALGSATASIATASALVAGLARHMPGQEVLLVLSVACGVTVGTQPADSGFWMVKEYGNLTASDVMVRFNGCRLFMALCGLGILLLFEWMLRPG